MDEIIVLSRGVQQYFADTDGRKTVFIPNGVERPEVLPAKLIKEKYGLDKNSYIYNIQDFNPEQVIAVGYTKNKLITNIMMSFDKFSCRQSNLIITVGCDLVETVRKRFQGGKVPRTVMINNWIDENEIYPLEKIILRFWHSESSMLWMENLSSCIQAISAYTMTLKI